MSNNNDNIIIVDAEPVIVTGRYCNSTENVIENVTENMKICYSLRKTVLLLSMIDMFFSFIYSFYNYWYFFSVLFSLLGYFGSKHYTSKYVFIYSIYLLVNLISRFLFIFYVIYLSVNNNIHYNSFFYIISIFCFLIEIWVLRIVYRFYNSLKILTLNEINFLKNDIKINNSLIYW